MNAFGEAGIESKHKRLSKLCTTNRPLLEEDQQKLCKIDFYGGVDVNALGKGGVDAKDERLSKICTTNRPLLENTEEMPTKIQIN